MCGCFRELISSLAFNGEKMPPPPFAHCVTQDSVAFADQPGVNKRRAGLPVFCKNDFENAVLTDGNCKCLVLKAFTRLCRVEF